MGHYCKDESDMKVRIEIEQEKLEEYIDQMLGVLHDDNWCWNIEDCLNWLMEYSERTDTP